MRILNFGKRAEDTAAEAHPARDTDVPLVLAKDVADPVLFHHSTPPKGVDFNRLTRAQLQADFETLHARPPADAA
jgi:hypothetical protein